MDIVKILCVLARTAPDDTCSAPDGDMPPVAERTKRGIKGTRRSFSHAGMGGGIIEHW